MKPGCLSRLWPAFWTLGLAAPGSLPMMAQSPAISFTSVPSFGAQGYLSGTVANVNPASFKVAVYDYVDGGWYQKPSSKKPLTTINQDGTWSANITPTVNDPSASILAAFVVPNSFSGTAFTAGTTGLIIPAQAIATAYAPRVDPSLRQFSFAGYPWWVRTSAGELQGPGPNYYSDSANNSWVDAQGFLHLVITATNNGWSCVEVATNQSFGYGQYRVTVDSPPSVLGTNAVLGMFTWSDDSAYNDREIDIEESQWSGQLGPGLNADFAVSPYADGQNLNFGIGLSTATRTQCLVWQSGTAAFQTLIGTYTPNPPGGSVLQTWNCEIGIPPPGGEQFHINLWLYNGAPPSTGAPVEVVISNFEFVPLGTPQQAHVQSLSNTGSAWQLTFSGVPEWHYEIQNSVDLLTWNTLSTVIATSGTTQFTDTPGTSPHMFYRVVTDP